MPFHLGSLQTAPMQRALLLIMYWDMGANYVEEHGEKEAQEQAQAEKEAQDQAQAEKVGDVVAGAKLKRSSPECNEDLQEDWY
jgi:hypothetical protein